MPFKFYYPRIIEEARPDRIKEQSFGPDSDTFQPKPLGEGINCITIIITLEIVENTKTEKNYNNTV